ncbi:MAG: cofactor-independent phosphoglycerate mutase [Vallitaleaceae bacterium]|jgi:2,3-bisphosphoglycerate-independent phosphoglycerate mutase|nr:cofactor-independent phosphoglycerate mutase [Vallitaleaceae bacterium]
MKYVVILGDGMADEPIESLGFKTPLDVAHKPTIDRLARLGEVGLVNTIPEGMKPGSDTANLSVIGYDPKIYYTGRSPLEAVSMGIEMLDDDICYRCNIIAISEDEIAYEDKTVIDHSADEISTKEAGVLLEAIQEAFGNAYKTFYPGVSYRHALIWKKGSVDVNLVPPHDILERRIGDYIPTGDHAEEIYDMMKTSYEILNHHPINEDRRRRGLRPANSIWIWGEGKKPILTSFEEKFGKKGVMVSAVDLLKGIAISAGMRSVDVVGATGNMHTNYEGKVEAVLQALADDCDFAYIHLEAPDECGHRGETDNKVISIEQLDDRVVKLMEIGLKSLGEPYRIMILPDHPTPINYRTHTSTPVPYIIYDSTDDTRGSGVGYSEKLAESTGVYKGVGHDLMKQFLQVD